MVSNYQILLILAVKLINTLIYFKLKTFIMSEDIAEVHSGTDLKKKQIIKDSNEDARPRDGQLASKMKRKRKSIAPKAYHEPKHENQLSNEKQIKLTELWKMPGLSQSISKNIMPDGTKKKLEEELQIKNRKIVELKKQRDDLAKKYNILQNEKKTSHCKIKQILRKAIIEIAKSKRLKRAQIIPNYGYYKDFNSGGFIEGPYIKQIKQAITQKNEELRQLIQAHSSCQDKENWEFMQRLIQKRIQQLNEQLKARQKVVIEYRCRLKFADKEANCHYAKKDWPAIGQDDRFQVLEMLGSGGYGQVYKCYDLIQNNYVALKSSRLNNAFGPKHEEARQQFLKHVNRQVKIQKTLNHPNIAKFIQIIKIDQNQVTFILQFCQGPELSKYYKKYGCLEQKEAKQIIRQVLSAIKYLYEQNNKIIHYDLKPSNIMFHRGTIKILDFGLCKQMETDDTKIDLTSPGVGTYWYLPPQTFRQGAEVSSKVDIWSIGVIFFQLLYGKRPFGHDLSQTKIMHQGIILKEAVRVEFPAQTPLKYKVSQNAKKFISQCLKYQQEDRLNPVEAYQHQYFR